MDHLEIIRQDLTENIPHLDIARKVFLTLPTKAFVGREKVQYQVLKKISDHFQIPISCVQVAGSAKIGSSIHGNTDFNPESSDLDVAIIDSNLFKKCTEIIFEETNAHSDRTNFPPRERGDTFKEYKDYLCKGIFRSDLMPTCSYKTDWNEFFGKLSRDHAIDFHNINAIVYLSELFFAMKQEKIIKTYAAKISGSP